MIPNSCIFEFTINLQPSTLEFNAPQVYVCPLKIALLLGGRYRLVIKYKLSSLSQRLFKKGLCRNKKLTFSRFFSINFRVVSIATSAAALFGYPYTPEINDKSSHFSLQRNGSNMSFH